MAGSRNTSEPESIITDFAIFLIRFSNSECGRDNRHSTTWAHFMNKNPIPTWKFHTCWIISPHGRLRVFITITPNRLGKPQGGGVATLPKTARKFSPSKIWEVPPQPGRLFSRIFFPSSYAGPKADSNIMHSSPSQPICRDFICVDFSACKTGNSWLPK